MARLKERFDMGTGRNLGRDKNGATRILQYLGPREKNDFGQLYTHNPQLEGTQFQQAENPDSYLNMDYEMHLGTKIDSFLPKFKAPSSDWDTASTESLWTRT